MSEANEKWTEDEFQKVFKGKDLDTITDNDFRKTMSMVHRSVGGDPTKWSFGECV